MPRLQYIPCGAQPAPPFVVKAGGAEHGRRPASRGKTGIANNPAQQLSLIEQSLFEEVWENVYDRLCKHLGNATANSWLKPLHLVGFQNGVLIFRAPTKFIAQTVESQYGHRLKSAWIALGYEVTAIVIEGKKSQSAA